MPDDFHMCPFRRSIEGPRGTVLLRRNVEHIDHCVKVIQRRPTPAWSTKYAELVERTA